MFAIDAKDFLKAMTSNPTWTGPQAPFRFYDWVEVTAKGGKITFNYSRQNIFRERDKPFKETAKSVFVAQQTFDAHEDQSDLYAVLTRREFGILFGFNQAEMKSRFVFEIDKDDQGREILIFKCVDFPSVMRSVRTFSSTVDLEVTTKQPAIGVSDMRQVDGLNDLLFSIVPDRKDWRLLTIDGQRIAACNNYLMTRRTFDMPTSDGEVKSYHPNAIADTMAKAKARNYTHLSIAPDDSLYFLRADGLLVALESCNDSRQDLTAGLMNLGDPVTEMELTPKAVEWLRKAKPIFTTGTVNRAIMFFQEEDSSVIAKNARLNDAFDLTEHVKWKRHNGDEMFVINYNFLMGAIDRLDPKTNKQNIVVGQDGKNKICTVTSPGCPDVETAIAFFHTLDSHKKYNDISTV